MNGLKPKIIRVGANKPKNNLGTPIVIKSFTQNITDVDGALIDHFVKSTCADEQLGILKNIIDGPKDLLDHKVIKFLSIVYYEAPAKHPVKCFLTRHVTKCSGIQKSFTELLSEIILSQLRVEEEYDNYADVVPKVLTCIENFPAGTAAVKHIDMELAKYLINCLSSCFENLRLPRQSPTKKNEIFMLQHSALRVLVHIIQKLNSDPEYNLSDWSDIFQSITNCIVHLISDEDLPMDTKCLGGILFLSVETLKDTACEAWIQLLMATGDACSILKHKEGQLAVYSAIATSVPMDKMLQPVNMDNTLPVLDLLRKLLNIVERSASEPALTLGAGRSLLAVSRGLAGARGAGARLTAPLLAFVWPHLEYHLDSVRHIAQQLLANVIQYCKDLERGFDGGPGDPGPLEELLRSVRALGPSRSFYWAVAHATAPLGAARVLRDLCAARDLLRDVTAPHLQAAAHAAMEALMSSGGSASDVFSAWVGPALAGAEVDALATLEALLPRAVRLHPDVVPLICEYIMSHGCPVRVTLACCRAAAACRAWLPCGTLRAAAVDADEETRVLALSVVCEAARPTAALSRGELSFALTFLRYNINSPSHSFRHTMLAHYNKLLNRLDDSYRVIKRRPDGPGAGNHYLEFLEQLRALCYSSVLPGANYGRRSVALQLLATVSRLQLTAQRDDWREGRVEALLLHLDDSYECNKALALEVLQSCPEELLRRACSAEVLRDVLRQAAALRPAGAVSAAYKLQLLVSRLPERLTAATGDKHWPLTAGEYAALVSLAAQVRGELEACRRGGVAAAARRGAMFGALHCAAKILSRQDIAARCWEASGGTLAEELVSLCMEVQDEVAPVVAAASPEGHLPPAEGPQTKESEITLDDGRPVTAQMVLICAWRSVKEASAVLGALAAALPGSRGALAARAGRHYTCLLAAAQHRGAVEQACVGLAALATRCWSCPELEHLPRAWLAEQLCVVSRGAALPATRRGAGLPFMIQTLVASELQATGHGTGLQACTAALLQLAADPDVASPRRTLAANILRALFRHAALAGATHAHVGAGLRVAVCGFDAASWPERTAMSLLFAALLVRVFGVSRVRRGTDARNTLTGRVFFQRYPPLYDVMLSKLGSGVESADGALRPAAYPALLLLARLHPSALDGAASNLKLGAFSSHVVCLARSPVLQTRRLAARAMCALVAPLQYFPHIERMFSLLSDCEIPRNYCHGILLQLSQLLEAPPTLPAPPGLQAGGVGGALWILRQATSARPCYVIAHEYVKVVNLLIWRLPELVGDDLVDAIVSCLEELLFTSIPPPVAAGRDLCLADCLYLYLVLLHKGNNIDPVVQLTLKSLRHKSYEVVLATLNYLLILHDNNLDTENDEICKFQEHLSLIRDRRVLDMLRESKTFLPILCNELHYGKYPECRHKCLRLLTLERNTQKLIVNDASIENEDLIMKLIHCVENEHENMTHLYLENLLEFASGKIGDKSLSARLILFVVRTVFAQSWAVNSDSARFVVVSFLEANLEKLMTMNLQNLLPKEKFELKATVLATLVTLLEDDDDVIRQRAADIAAKLSRAVIPGNVIPSNGNIADVIPSDVTHDDVISSSVMLSDVIPGNGSLLPSLCGELLRDYIETVEDSAAMFVMLALLDFKSEVVMTDELNDECRVFDQSERYNMFLEESVWTAACADKIIQNYRQEEPNLIDFVLSIVHDTQYSFAIEKLCKDNLVLFETRLLAKDESINPKIQLFIRKLSV